MGLDINLRSEIQGEKDQNSSLSAVPQDSQINDTIQDFFDILMKNTHDEVETVELDVEENPVPWWEAKINELHSLLDNIKQQCSTMTEEESKAIFENVLDRADKALNSFMNPPEEFSCEPEISVSREAEYIQSLEQIEPEPIEIDKDYSWLNNSTVKLMLKSVPNYATKIFYSVSGNKNGEKTISGHSNIMSVTRDEYLRDGMIRIQSVTENEICISVFCQYEFPNGESCVSDTVEIVLSDKPKKRIGYRLEWKGGRGWLPQTSRVTSAKLIIHTESEFLPEIQLIYRKDGYIPSGLDEVGAISLGTFGGITMENDSKTMFFELPVSELKNIASKTALKLVLSDNSLTDYELVCEDIASMQTR